MLRKMVLLASLSSGCLLAQLGTATLVGTVTDPGGASIPGAKLELKHMATNQVFATTCNAAGDFVTANLPTGNYEAQVRAPGFKTELKTGILLEIGQTVRADFTLAI